MIQINKFLIPPPTRKKEILMDGIIMHGTTILTVRHKGQVVMVGDGQVTMGNAVVKHTARKLRRLAHGRVLAGFAGSTADGLTLCEKFEKKIEEYNGNLRRSAVELARDWRADRVLRRLEALMAVADRESSLLISGSGDVLEPDDGLIAIGSGGNFALAAARVLVKHSELDARTIAVEAMKAAAEICVFTNDNIIVEEL
jgi:ATP-dependent HslUV protease subunit HslV